jgi:hypothetical protein
VVRQVAYLSDLGRLLRLGAERGSEETARDAGDEGPPLLDHLIRLDQHRLRDRQPKRLGGLEIDDELELGRLLDWQVGGLGALQDLIYVGGGAHLEIRRI